MERFLAAGFVLEAFGRVLHFLADRREGIAWSIWYRGTTAELLAEKAAEKEKATYLLVCVFIYKDEIMFLEKLSLEKDIPKCDFVGNETTCE